MQIPMHGNVNLAVETCGKTFHRFKTYLNFSSPQLATFDPEGCAWAFGMNLFDLQTWRRHDFTLRYHFWQQQVRVRCTILSSAGARGFQ